MHSHRRMSRLPLLIVVGLFLAAAFTMPVQAKDPKEDYLPGEVVVELQQKADLAAVAQRYKLDPVPLDQFGAQPIYRLRILDGADPKKRADQLEKDDRVAHAEPNYLGKAPESRQRSPWASGGESPGHAQDWILQLMRIPEAQTVTRGAGVTVAVLDTGVDPNHPALAGRLVPGYDFVDLDNDPREEGVYGQNVGYGHGTHVAGLVALVAPEAKIMPIRVLDPDGVGNVWVLAQALDYAADHGADVINLSLGTQQKTELLHDVINSLNCAEYDKNNKCKKNVGIVVVSAAGNDGSNDPDYPAAEAEKEHGSLAMAASTADDTLADFSNWGKGVKVMAPGVDVLSSVPNNAYGFWSGTSMATPLASGVAALVRATYPLKKADQVVEQIEKTADKVGGRVNKRIDAAAAVGIDDKKK